LFGEVTIQFAYFTASIAGRDGGRGATSCG